MGITTAFRDSIALRESYETYLAFLQAENFDYIVLKSASLSWEHDKRLIHTIAQRLPRTRFIITGPITRARRDGAGRSPQHSGRGSGRIRKRRHQGSEWRQWSRRFRSSDRRGNEQRALPLFRCHLCPPRYWDSNPVGQKAPQLQILTSRGCPYKCIFCVWPTTMTGHDPDGSRKRTVRQYNAEYLEALLTELIGRYHFQSVYFDDDTFNLGDRHVEKVCAIMRKLDVPWSAMCRADTSSFHLWQEMKDSGCFGVKIGFESGNQDVVDKIVNKRLDLEEARRVAFEVRRVGMTLHGTFTFGLPGETHEQMQDTERYIASLPLNSIQKSGCAEIEGAPLHSLNTEKSLKAYPDARIDANYVRATDGQAKIERMLKEEKGIEGGVGGG